MYSIGGVALDNPAAGWEINGRTKTLTAVSRDLVALRLAGRDGTPRLPGSWDAPIWPLYMRVERRARAALQALITGGSQLEQSGMSVGYSPGSIDVIEDHLHAGYSIISYALRLDGVFWRNPEVTTAAASLAAASVTVKCLNADGGLSAPVSDAIVRVKGAVGSLQVTDAASGAWFTFPSVAADRWLRFEADSGRAFLTSTDTWTGGAEVSGDVDFGGPRGNFEITPFFPNPLDPTVREGRLTVTTATRTSASIQVRARAAHLV